MPTIHYTNYDGDKLMHCERSEVSGLMKAIERRGSRVKGIVFEDVLDSFVAERIDPTVDKLLDVLELEDRKVPTDAEVAAYDMANVGDRFE